MQPLTKSKGGNMELKELKSKSNRIDEEQKLLVVQTFLKNEELYSGKSDSWNLRITADELGMRKDDVAEILSEALDEE